jgi:hypothetical protein
MSQSVTAAVTLEKLKTLPTPTRLEQIKVIDSQFSFLGYPILFARNYEKQYLILFRLTETVEALTDQLSMQLSSGFSIRNRELENKETGVTSSYLELAASRYIDISLLSAVVDEVLSEISGDNPQEIIDTCKKVIDRWKRILSLESRQKLSLIEQIGLIGELICLKHFLEIDVLQDLSSWTGPDGGVHDFEFAHQSIEVKTTSSPGSKTINISGLWQLEQIDEVPLLLLHLEIRPDPMGTTIGNLYDSIVSIAGDQEDRLNLLLLNVGFDPNKRNDYSNFTFSFVQVAAYEIRDDFPKLTSSTLSELDPTGRLSDVTYSIDLSNMEMISGNSLEALRLFWK